MDTSHPFRVVRPLPRPLGLYFRAARNDHVPLATLLAQGRRAMHGVVVEAIRMDRHAELVNAANDARIETILDPSTAAAATLGGHGKSHGQLPWGVPSPDQVEHFSGLQGAKRVDEIAKFAVEHNFSEAMAPTHLVKGIDDPWLAIDRENAERFRTALDRVGGRKVGMIYPLCVSYKVFRTPALREALIDELHGIPADALWLRVEGMGHDCTPSGLRNYLDAARDFAQLDLPVVADQMGGLPGLALLAAGVVGGLSCGLATGQSFSTGHWHKPREGEPFMAPSPVYLAELDLFLPRKAAKELFEKNLRLRGHLGCGDSDCCHRGVDDMLGNASRHFAVQKMRQVLELGRHTQSVRMRSFLDSMVRPATDRSLQFARASGVSEDLQKRVMKHVHRLDSLRNALEKMLASNAVIGAARIPDTRVLRENSASSPLTF